VPHNGIEDNCGLHRIADCELTKLRIEDNCGLRIDKIAD